MQFQLRRIGNWGKLERQNTNFSKERIEWLLNWKFPRWIDLIRF